MAAEDTPASENGWYRIGAAGQSLILHAKAGARPRICHWGAALADSSPAELDLLAYAQAPLGSATQLVHGTLSNEAGVGLSVAPGLLVQRGGTSWAVDLRVTDVKVGPSSLTIACSDERNGVKALYGFAFCAASGVLTATTQMENCGTSDLEVEWCSAPVLPVDRRLDRITGFSGRWAGEFQRETVARSRSTYLRENRAGRTSHDMYPAILLSGTSSTEDHGLAAAAHLAWSGNARLRVDTAQDGRAFLQAGELLLPGEIVLAPSESYRSPELVVAASEHGIGPTSRALHTMCAKPCSMTVPGANRGRFITTRGKRSISTMTKRG